MIRSILSVSAAATGCLLADHGRDYLLLQDANSPAVGQWYLFSNYGWTEESGPDEHTLETGFSTGILPRTSFTGTLQYSDDAVGSWDWNSTVATLHFDLTPKRAGFPVKLGFSLGREFDLAGEDDHEESHEHAVAITDPSLDPGFDPGPDWIPPDAQPHTHGETASHEHDHTGIHQHGIDAWHIRFIAETDLGKNTRLAANLIGLFPDDGDSAFYGYALGLRHSFHHDFAAGLEVTGDFDRHLYQKAAVAVYFSPLHSLTLKLGLGLGLNAATPDHSLLTGAVWRF